MILCLFSLFFLTPIMGLNVTSVSSGVVLGDRQDVYSAGSFVEIFVTIQYNRESDYLESVNVLLNRLHEEIRKLNYSSSLTTVLGQRIYLLKERIRGPTSGNRRGLLDIVGDITHALFGTARDSDVRALNSAMSQLRHSVHALVSTQGKTVAVINKLAQAHNQLRQQIAILNRNFAMQ